MNASIKCFYIQVLGFDRQLKYIHKKHLGPGKHWRFVDKYNQSYCYFGPESSLAEKYGIK
jgi:hypothetical protein